MKIKFVIWGKWAKKGWTSWLSRLITDPCVLIDIDIKRLQWAVCVRINEDNRAVDHVQLAIWNRWHELSKEARSKWLSSRDSYGLRWGNIWSYFMGAQLDKKLFTRLAYMGSPGHSQHSPETSICSVHVGSSYTSHFSHHLARVSQFRRRPSTVLHLHYLMFSRILMPMNTSLGLA